MNEKNINILRIRKDYQQVERRMQAEYLAEFYSHLKTFQNLRLGKIKSALFEEIPKDIDPRIFLVKNPRADAVVIAPTTMYLLEFALEMDWKHVGQLLYYLEHLKDTADLKEFFPTIVKPRLIYAVYEPAAAKYAMKKSITIEYYVRPWMLPKIAKIKKHYLEGTKE